MTDDDEEELSDDEDESSSPMYESQVVSCTSSSRFVYPTTAPTADSTSVQLPDQTQDIYEDDQVTIGTETSSQIQCSLYIATGLRQEG